MEQRGDELLSLVFDRIQFEDQGVWTCASAKLKSSNRKQFKLVIYGNLNPSSK